MSQTFKIIPKEKRARKEVERLSVSQFVAYMDGEFDYLTDLVYRGGTYMSDEAELAQLITEGNFAFGKEFITSRAFILICDKKSLNVRINTPATTKDWQTALAFIKMLAMKTDAIVITEAGTELSLSALESYDYKPDILAGIKNLQEAKGDDIQQIVGPCDRIIYLDVNAIKNITGAPDPIAAFDTTLEKVFHTDGAPPTQYFLPFRKRDGSDEFLIGYHILFSNFPTILPIQPRLYPKNIPLIRKRYGGVQKWLVGLAIPGQKEPFFLSHEQVIESLQRCRKIDANQLYVERLTREEMIAMVKKYE